MFTHRLANLVEIPRLKERTNYPPPQFVIAEPTLTRASSVRWDECDIGSSAEPPIGMATDRSVECPASAAHRPGFASARST